MRQAARDVDNGHVDVPRGPATQRHYSDLTEQAQAAPDAGPKARP